MQMLALAGLAAFGPDGRLSLAYVTTLSVADTAILIALMLWLLRAHGDRPGDVFLGQRRLAREGVVGLILTPVVLGTAALILLGIERFAPWLRNVPDNPLEDLVDSAGSAVLFAVVSIVAGGVREEMQRAFILRRFEQHLGGAALGLVLFSLAFGLGHAIQGWDAVIATATLGAFWGVVYLRRRSIVAPALSHSGFNVAEILRHSVFT